MYFRIFSTIQDGRTKDFSSSNFRSKHPLGRHWRDDKGRVMASFVPTEADGGLRKAPCVLPVVIAGSQVSDVLLNEKVGLEARESG